MTLQEFIRERFTHDDLAYIISSKRSKHSLTNFMSGAKIHQIAFSPILARIPNVQFQKEKLDSYIDVFARIILDANPDSPPLYYDFPGSLASSVSRAVHPFSPHLAEKWIDEKSPNYAWDQVFEYGFDIFEFDIPESTELEQIGSNYIEAVKIALNVHNSLPDKYESLTNRQNTNSSNYLLAFLAHDNPDFNALANNFGYKTYDPEGNKLAFEWDLSLLSVEDFFQLMSPSVQETENFVASASSVIHRPPQERNPRKRRRKEKDNSRNNYSPRYITPDIFSQLKSYLNLQEDYFPEFEIGFLGLGNGERWTNRSHLMDVFEQRHCFGEGDISFETLFRVYQDLFPNLYHTETELDRYLEGEMFVHLALDNESFFYESDLIHTRNAIRTVMVNKHIIGNHHASKPGILKHINGFPEGNKVFDEMVNQREINPYRSGQGGEDTYFLNNQSIANKRALYIDMKKK